MRASRATWYRRRHRPAHATDVANRVRAELAAQRVQVHFDGIALDRLVPAVELLLELRTRQHRRGSRHQGFEQGELAWRERDRLAGPGHLARGGIERDVAVL